MKGQLNFLDELIIDNFAGGGGASCGIELATGRPVDIAINHDPDAIAMHKANHPYTRHYQESVWDIDPKEICQGHKVGLAWFSPDCKHFSKAKGGKPVDKNIRGLAWIVLKWAGTVRPRVIILENVEEFQTWGPVRKGKPVKSKQGQTFERWKSQLSALGYEIEHRELRACDYGAPTIRKRFFLVARCDGEPIVFPKPTHGDPNSEEVKSGKLKPWKTAADCIDFSLPAQSIFERKKPLVTNTLRRIARGLDKFVINEEKPFIIPIGYGERKGQKPRLQDIDKPLTTIVSSCKQYLVSPALIQYHSETDVYLKEYDSKNLGHWSEIRELLNTYTDWNISANQVLIFCINGVEYFISDIGLRMLQPKELYKAQGFPDDYIIDKDCNGKEYNKTKQVARCGNAVPPPFSKALVMANCKWLCDKSCNNMKEFNAVAAG